MAIKKLVEIAVDEHHQSQSWLINPRQYEKLRGPLETPPKRAVLSDEEWLELFAALADKSGAQEEVARLQRVYGLRM